MWRGGAGEKRGWRGWCAQPAPPLAALPRATTPRLSPAPAPAPRLQICSWWLMMYLRSTFSSRRRCAKLEPRHACGRSAGWEGGARIGAGGGRGREGSGRPAAGLAQKQAVQVRRSRGRGVARLLLRWGRGACAVQAGDLTWAASWASAMAARTLR